MTITNHNAKYRKDYTAPTYHVEDIHLTFELIANATRVTQVSKYNQHTENANSLLLDGVDQTLISLKINGEEYSDFTVNKESLALRNLPASFELEIITEIDPANNSSLEGLYLSDGAYCTQCEAEGFRKITYFQDRPDVLTTYTVKIIGDKSFKYLLSNGNKIEEGELDDGRHYAVWQDPHKKPCYLFALVAGDFDLLADTFVTNSGREVALELFVDKGNLDKAPHAMQSLIKSMQWDESRFNLEYDLDVYMIVAVDFFNMGAMENKGLNIFNSRCVLANQATATDRDFHTIESIIGHEYFHNWTGNRVTCQDWFQLSLKEGLTVFRDQEFSSDLGSRAINRIDAVKVMRTHQFAEDAGPMAHPIRPDKVIEMNNFYTVTVYNKGAEVIRMIHTLLGEAGFMKGMALYIERHDGTASTCDDFVAAMMDASGVDLTQFKRWYSQSGTPTVHAKYALCDKTNTLTLTLKQTHPETADKQEKYDLHIPVSVELINETGGVIPLMQNGQSVSKVLDLKTSTHVYTFDNVENLAAITLLEDFSAPCKLEFEQTDAALITQVKYASSDFTRWDSMQTLLINQIKSGVNAVEHNSNVSLDDEVISLYKTLLNEDFEDKALLAELLKLPSFDTVAAEYELVPIDQLVSVIKQFEQQIADTFKSKFASIFNQVNDDGSTDAKAVSARAIKSIALFYLAKAEDNNITQLIDTQFESDNMTNCMSALSAAVYGNTNKVSQLLGQFKDKWQHDVLVMDKWLALNAQLQSKDIVSHIESLYSESFFDIRNPNRVRSLLSTFAMFNTEGFHHISGSGYRLLTDMLIKLNDINPQNASRMLTPLLSFKRFDKARQALMIEQLERLQNLDNLSPDLFEKVNSALG